MYYLSLIIIIVGSVIYTFFQNITPANVNPIVALSLMYLGGIVIAMPFYLHTRREHHRHKRHFQLRTLYFALTNIVIDLGYLLAFRSGWTIGTLNIVSSIVILIVLAVTGVVFFREKLSPINIAGIIIGVIGLTLLNI